MAMGSSGIGMGPSRSVEDRHSHAKNQTVYVHGSRHSVYATHAGHASQYLIVSTERIWFPIRSEVQATALGKSFSFSGRVQKIQSFMSMVLDIPICVTHTERRGCGAPSAHG